MSAISPAQAGGRLCLELSLSPSWTMMVLLAATLRVRGWIGREAAAFPLRSGPRAGGKGGPETPTGPPGHFILQTYKCSSDVFGVRLLDSQGNLVRKGNPARQKFDPYASPAPTSITPRQKHMHAWPHKKPIQ